MHIEPGLVDSAKIALSYATAAGVLGFSAREIVKAAGSEGLGKLVIRAVATTALVFTFFEILPHYKMGVSEVHFILGSTLFLIFGAAPAAIGLACGLLIQGMTTAPADLPQYGMNVTTLLAPLFVMQALAARIIPAKTAYVDLRFDQAFKLSLAYQGGIVAWVTFWALYGGGFTATNLAEIGTFGGAYMLVVLVEPVADLVVLAAAKSLRWLQATGLTQMRVYHAA